ncbi:MAG: hypothetical protein ABIP27_07830 [Flavobacterium circumlabens]|uniref:Uncharacterized protein n=1 Tax=Flavobacterium circumlabens TaxID=2133765 RepID=A0A4Y7UEW3_9FLAO|nr:hypothetical protein [Flavobacterium circumlabens]TCN59447.1 hypothetical protein EV142_10263 [Flavobacterium circumlabens]TEB44751.1 hypothetical protein D0809_06000 [Flavobacterium circumlabens]
MRITKIILSFLLLVFCNISFAQKYFGQIVTIKNDTLSVEIKLDASSFNVNKLMYLQDKISVIQNGVTSTYLPKDLKSFKIRLEKEVASFESVDELSFAQILYSNKIKLYKVLNKISYNNIIRVYVIKKPNDTHYFNMQAMGLSRLITKNAMLPAIEDCKVSYEKINNDEIKIKDEKILVEFIKDYESNCF